MRLAKECKVAIIEKTYDGGVCLPERSANMSLRGKLVVFWMKHRPRHIATTQMVALMFAAIILLGALLLTLPAASREGVSCGLRPALFTATSATCVTGLVLYDTWSQWSGFGQVVILCLIQIGGLGFMSVATLLIFLLRRKIGLQQRLMIAQSLSVSDIMGVVRLQKLVLTGSFSVEAVGAIILTLRFWPEYGFTRALRWGVFHSVSAFCNAGFDIFGSIAPGQSLIEFNADPVVLLTLSALIIIGGLGFLVWENIVQKRSFGKFSVYARMVLLMTAALLAVGWAGTCLLEWNNSETLGGMTVGEKLLNGFFQSATLRTAGFAAIDYGKRQGLFLRADVHRRLLRLHRRRHQDCDVSGSGADHLGESQREKYGLRFQADDPRRADPERHDHRLYRAGTGRFRRHLHQRHIAHELYGRRV